MQNANSICGIFVKSDQSIYCFDFVIYNVLIGMNAFISEISLEQITFLLICKSLAPNFIFHSLNVLFP